MKSDHSITAQAWSSDGQMLAFRHNATTGFAIGVLPRGGKPRLFLKTAFTEIDLQRRVGPAGKQ